MKNRFENPYCPPGSIITSGFLRGLVQSGLYKIDFVEDDGSIVLWEEDKSLLSYLAEDGHIGKDDYFVHTIQARCLKSEDSSCQETGFFIWLSSGTVPATRRVMISLVSA